MAGIWEEVGGRPDSTDGRRNNNPPFNKNCQGVVYLVREGNTRANLGFQVAYQWGESGEVRHWHHFTMGSGYRYERNAPISDPDPPHPIKTIKSSPGTSDKFLFPKESWTKYGNVRSPSGPSSMSMGLSHE
ncbi:hypothetical protein Btru_039442 [Bulinus truncatus]|nr:hypothetical protein Btru_039442 [Bulinus truncatus]